ncbi:MAG TPA: hypothetical protein VKU00_13850 [Chthonomonadaceae bacterium]|nr:hypothetical protein [Chthonomonadaceae bacterium]
MAGTWQGLVNQPPFEVSSMFLLSDGRVMVQEEATAHWHALTPDSSGSYINGTWSPLKDMSFWRRYYASGTLKDGRFILIGGEQSGDGGDSNKGEIYDPVSDTWTPLPPPGTWTQVGDASCCILPDGRLMIGALLTPECIIYDPVTNSWSPAASKAVRSNEESWVLLPDDTIVTIQCFPPYETEKYIISADMWKSEGALPVPIVDHVMHEIGPGMLLYNGHVIYFGAAKDKNHAHTVLYTPPAFPTGTGVWKAGPQIPIVNGQTMVCNDSPATLLPNGKVLFASAPFENNDWGKPILFFEYDPASNTIAQAPTPSNNEVPAPPYPKGAQLYWSRQVLLPTGQMLFSPSSTNIQCYTPVGGPQEAWRPTISAVIPHCNPPYCLLKGTQLNGLSQANMYGDDCCPATNYPLVRLRNTATNRIYYCRTYDFSTMGVATGASLQSVRFDISKLPYGNYDLCVVANGISSHCVDFCHCRPHEHCCCEGHEKRECGCCKESCCHSSCCCGEQKPDPIIIRLQDEVQTLQNTVRRLTSQTQIEEGARQTKEVTKE